MDCTNCRLKTCQFKDVDGRLMYGFILTARKEAHEFYSMDEAVINDWIN